MSKLNPLNKSEKEIQRVEPELETDQFSEKESEDIVKIVMDNYDTGLQSMQDYLERKALDLKHYYCEKPSVLENLEKKSWQSDRNLGLCPAVCDSYQATLLATTWNPDTIHFIATEENDIDNKNNLEQFAKWVVEPAEGNFFPQVDDFIHNRIVLGFSVFKLYWKVWYEWCDRRIPKKTGGYDIKTEKVRFEKGVLENIPNIDDFITSEYGKNLQETNFCIHIIHTTGDKVLDAKKRKIYNIADEKFIDRLKQVCLDRRREGLDKEKSDALGITDISLTDIRLFPVDLYEWYGQYTKNGKTEEYRFIVEPLTRTLLAGKPLRKITRTGKRPFVGGSLIRIPGRIRGRSLPTLVAPIINAFNNVFNQKSDFQYVTNCPFGFHNPEEGYQQQEYDLEPGISYPVGGKPNEVVYFPNLQRSMAWAESDIRILLELLERLTGAASYFLTSGNTQQTATRDNIINEKSETRFGLWVKRILMDIEEAVTMYINMYQDWAPPKLGIRVLGKDGKKLFKNLSIETLRGNYDCQMSPDLIAGSKNLEKQVQMWLFQSLSQSIWCAPQTNPRGSWNLHADTMKALGRMNPERYIGPEPKLELGKGKQVEDEWAMFMQGEDFDPPEGENPLEHLIGHMQQKENQYFDLDEEYRPNFDKHLFKTVANFQKFLRDQQHEKIANALALQFQGQPQGQPQGPVMPAQPPGQPGAPILGQVPSQPTGGAPVNIQGGV